MPARQSLESRAAQAALSRDCLTLADLAVVVGDRSKWETAGERLLLTGLDYLNPGIAVIW